ncbi:MAG: hypothetical protein ACI4E3_00745 [Candidatus Fimousia sp.]
MKRCKLRGILFIGLSLVILSSCGIFRDENDSKSMKKYCEKYVSEYKVMEKKDNGSVMISVNAPDFKRMLEVIIEENEEKDITVDDIEKVAKKYPDYKKEYKFWVDTEEDDEIKKAFLNEVSKELIVEAIKNVEYTDEWSVEE